MDNGFQFGERCTRDFDMYVQHRPRQKIPARRGKTFKIPGRSGVLHQMEDAWENYLQPYDCYFHGKQPMPLQAHAIKAWLCSDSSPRKLRDAYDPEFYHWATFLNAADIDNVLNRYGKVTLKFDCDPRAFLVTGDEPVRFDTAGVLHNAMAFAAQPVITVYGSGSGNVYVGGTTVEILEISDQITLDCELMDAYQKVGDGPKENKNGCISAPVFPVLGPGENNISWDGGITALEIIPRWWTL